MRKFALSIAVTIALLLGLVFSFGSQAQGGVTGFANLRITNFYRAAPRTAVAVTMNGYMTATGTYQNVTAAGTVATSGAKIAVKPAGTWLTMINTSANQITFTETGTLRSAGNIVLGQYDAATLWSDGTNWYQVNGSNN